MIKNYYSLRKLGKPYGLTCSKMAGIGLCSLLLCASPQAALADVASADVIETVQQTTKIKGTVVDNTGFGVIGAAVVVKGTTNGVVTDFDGNFELDAKVGDVLEISYVGYKTLTVKATAQHMNLTMEEDNEMLDEVVVVGYGTTSKRKTTSAVSQVKADDIAKTPVPNITQSLAGRAPGLIVQQSGGGVNSKASISIRGGGTPLYVIDGIICEERDFQNLNTEDIDQMSVLKDASATAIYGARAANGIIMVKTKNGQTGKLNIDYSFNYTLSQPAYLAKKVDSYTAAKYVNRGREYDGYAPTYSEDDLKKFLDGSDPQGHANTDWQDITMRDFAPEKRHNLSISGGSETMKIYTGIGYYDQESIYRTNSNNMQRYNFRTNLEAYIKSIGLKITSGVDAYLVDTKEPATSGGNGIYYIWSHIQNKKPMEAAYNPFGQIYNGTADNPLLDISGDGGYYQAKETSVRGNIGLEWDLPWVEGLKLKTLGSYSLLNDHYKTWNKTAPSYDWNGNIGTAGKPKLSKTANHREYFNVQFFADYARTFNDHTVGATFGMEASGNDYDNLSASRKDYVLDVDQMAAGPSSTMENSSAEGIGVRRATFGMEASGNDYDNLSASRKDYVLDVDQMAAGPSSTMENSSAEGIGVRRAAFIGRVKYDYKAKYMAEFNIRHDGSDYFPEGNRWGTFFSGSLAWAVSDEKFFEDWGLNKVFDNFKVRTSYGEIGQDGSQDGRLGRYAYYSSYSLNQRGQYLGGQFVPTFSEGNLVSPDITWYTTKDFNIGVDFASLNSRLSGSIDYFAKITTGYLASPSNVGYTAPLGKSLPKVMSNGESIRRGFEFVLQWKDQIGDLKYGVSANLTTYDDRWNINPDEAETSLKNPYKRGTQVGSYAGVYYNCLGYYKDYMDVLNSPKRNSSTNLMAGDLKHEDFNGDGKIDGDDQYRQGTGSRPRANYGIAIDLNYKGWFMNMLWQGATNYNYYLEGVLRGTGEGGYLPVIYDFQTDIWAPDNRDALYPRQHSSNGFNGGNNTVGTNFWLVDAHYIRLKNMSVGYDFKHNLLKNVKWMSKCTLALSGNNLLTFSPAKKYGFDPETGRGDGYSYPISRVYTISLNIGF